MRTNVFGLDVELPWPVEGCASRAWSRQRPHLEVVVADAGTLAAAWDSAGAERLVREPAQGRALLTVDVCGGAYRVAWRHIGEFLLTTDSRVLVTREPGAEDDWERYLLAQVLPLAAVMAGIEVLHASAVMVDGRAIGIAGASGAGKSTTADALVRAGAELMSDDVLALTREDGRLIAHPGPGLVRMGPLEAKEAIPFVTTESPAPLHALFFLDRTAASESIGGAIGFRRLAGATFNLLVRTPERLERHLEIASALAADGIPVAAAFAPNSTPDQIAAALLAWLRGPARR